MITVKNKKKIPHAVPFGIFCLIYSFDYTLFAKDGLNAEKSYIQRKVRNVKPIFT